MKKYIEFTCNCGTPYKVEVTPVIIPTIGPENDESYVYDYWYHCYVCNKDKKATYTKKDIIEETG